MSESEENAIFVDKTRRYDNQIIIRTTCNFEKIEGYLKLYSSEFSPEICIEPAVNTRELQAWLSNQGFETIFDHEFLHLLSSDFVSTQRNPTSVVVERWEEDRVDDFLTLLKTSGLECSNEIWAQKRSLYCTDTFRCYVAKVDGDVCSWATSFIDNDYAILANAYTQEDYRGKGCQKALLSTRIQDATEMGVEVFLTDVMPDSVSSRNCKSVGFSSLGIREVWGKS
ncbi:GNAT family N-acetyltransferase [Moritella sp. JT01]|uniref:GNAT family N-acetyltransferase n=1 Tax=Moritella sp. JT01 TaxID=756698 RepID=UPI0018DD51C6|nr:GNAT family N-acetyltransferase [Moritella sp. JT01]